MEQKQIRQSVLKVVSDDLRDNLKSEQHFCEVLNNEDAIKAREKKTWYFFIFKIIAIIAITTVAYQKIQQTVSETLKPDGFALLDPGMSFQPVITLLLAVVVVLFLNLVFSWVIDTARYWNINPVHSSDNEKKAKAMRERIELQIDCYERDDQGAFTAGKKLYQSLYETTDYSPGFNEGTRKALLISLVDICPVDDAFDLALLVKKHASENEYYIALRSAEQKGNLDAAKALARLVQPKSRQGGAAIVVAALALGIAIS